MRCKISMGTFKILAFFCVFLEITEECHTQITERAKAPDGLPSMDNS